MSDQLPILQGAEFWVQFVCTDSTNASTDFTGYTATAQLRRYEDRSSALLATFEVGLREDDGSVSPALDDSGQIWLHLDSDVTSDIVHNGYGDVKLVGPGGEVQTFIEFQTTIDPAVTA